MHDELELVPFSDLVEVNPHTKLPSSGSCSFLGMSDVTDDGRIASLHVRDVKGASGYTAFQDGDVLFAKITPCMENGKGARVDELVSGFGFGSTEFHVLRPRGSVDGRFVEYWTQSRKLRGAAEAFMIGSAGQRRVLGDFFFRYKIPHLPLAEQCMIADVIDGIGDAISVSESTVGKIKVARSSMVGWELDKVRQEGVIGEGLANLSSEGGIYLKTGPFGSALKESDWVDHGVPVITIGSLGDGCFLKDDLLFVSSKKAHKLSGYAVDVGDIVFSRVADVGRSVVVSSQEAGWIISSNLMRISLDPKKVFPGYFHLLISRDDEVRSSLRREVNSAGRDIVNGLALKSVLFPIPPMGRQKEILSLVACYDERIAAEQAQLEKLRKLKSGLMDDLLTGRVRVNQLKDLPV
ncbi:restriction endonuclease subunit S [Nocardiopsis sp. M1B1]|uniref:restriction endonuclease subunit S n=1 Tax=Nocardiopsis sp. M1B1 TaxID=3450454 RepID=UPI00403A4706